jgi:hypothetical protein
VADVKNRVNQELQIAVARLHHLGGAVATEDLPGTVLDSCHFADEVDGIQVHESREVGWATRHS